MSTILTLAATGLTGLVLGAGIGAAAASPSPSAPAERAVTAEAMETMHDTMVGSLPSEAAEVCDTMHTDMAGYMGDAGHTSMMGSSGSMMDGGTVDVPAGHDGHHSPAGQ